MINRIISECSKLRQEYKTRHDWVRKVTHWEMCKKFKDDHKNKCNMHKPASVRENDYDIQKDHLISDGRPILIIINKKKKKKRENLSTSTLLRNWKKSMEHEGDNYTYCDRCFWYSN